jgi:hypothetical protein
MVMVALSKLFTYILVFYESPFLSLTICDRPVVDYFLPNTDLQVVVGHK